MIRLDFSSLVPSLRNDENYPARTLQTAGNAGKTDPHNQSTPESTPLLNRLANVVRDSLDDDHRDHLIHLIGGGE
ncbi:MAG: hypothetical protein P1U77_27450 [Rubripirellula sp.]|nr:hypothetical protein [Rubripirellula sp.]